jgi:hypothetical protein
MQRLMSIFQLQLDRRLGLYEYFIRVNGQVTQFEFELSLEP